MMMSMVVISGSKIRFSKAIHNRAAVNSLMVFSSSSISATNLNTSFCIAMAHIFVDKTIAILQKTKGQPTLSLNNTMLPKFFT